MNYFVKSLLEQLLISIKVVFLLEPLFYVILISQTITNTGTSGYEDMRMRGYQQAPRVHERKDMRM